MARQGIGVTRAYVRHAGSRYIGLCENISQWLLTYSVYGYILGE